jgi:pyruvate,orthophosphate dikinase
VNEFYGEFLINAQGEDVVAGVRTPQPVLELKKLMPEAYAELLKVRERLEKHFKDVQDVEFTIQDRKLFMLQTRNGKRTAAAALKFSMDMFKEKLIDWKTAVMRNPADQLDQLLAPIFDVAEVKKATAIATGLPAGPGAASGRFTSTRTARPLLRRKARRSCSCATKRARRLARHDCGRRHPYGERRRLITCGARCAADGKVCICGASALQIDYAKKTVSVDGKVSKKAITSRSTARLAQSTPASLRPRRARSSPACCTGIKRRRRRRNLSRSISS